MVVLGTIALFIFLLDVPCFSNEYIAERKVFRDNGALVEKKKVLSYTFRSLVVKKEIYHSLFLEEEYEEILQNKHQDVCCSKRYLTLCTLALFPSHVCTNLSAPLYSGFMDVISRLPPPGGTTALDILQSVLITSYHLSYSFMTEFQNISSSHLRVDIIFDADYETVLGEYVVEFQHFLQWNLKRIFRRNQSDIHSLTIKKGSIGITFFIHLLNCVHSKKLKNRFISSETNPFQHKQKFLMKNVKKTIFDETGFLRYLNYHPRSKRYTVLRRVPFSVKTSTLERPQSGFQKFNLLDSQANRRDLSKNKDFLITEITSTLQYDIDALHEVSKAFLRENSDRRLEEKENSHPSHSKILPPRKSQSKRIRRYVAREDDTAMKLKFQFKLEKPAENGNDDQFQRYLVSQLAKMMRVPIPCINDMKIMSDTEVSFTLTAFNDGNNVMDDLSVIEAADSLKAKIRSQQLRLKDQNGQLLMTAGKAYASVDENSSKYSLVILVILCIILLFLTILIITVIYIARRATRNPRSSTKHRKEVYRNFQAFGRDSSQSIGKYSYDSGLWLGPGPEPNFTVPDAPYYRPPTVEQIASTPRPVTAVRTRLKKNWNVDDRALSTIPDDFGRNYIAHESPPPR